MPRPAEAALIELGNGLIYDTTQNLTWLQDAMYTRTSGFDTDGRMTYDEAVSWADNLVYGGFDDWRLPRSERWRPGLPCGGSCGGDSELSRMLVDLGWRWDFSDYQPGRQGPFLNFPQNTFWLANNVWWSASYDVDWADASVSRAWAVREGNPMERVPEPSTLLLIGLGTLAAARFRQQRRSLRISRPF
jgi:hypothetical protein